MTTRVRGAQVINKTAIKHWLGGRYVTPACGAWAFAQGERTDLYIPERRITCRRCLALLKKDKEGLEIYRKRLATHRHDLRTKRSEIAKARGWLRDNLDGIPHMFRGGISEALARWQNRIEELEVVIRRRAR